MLVQTNHVPQIILTGKSGRSYSFSIYSIASVWNSVGAVYGVLRDDSTHWALVYIGQTGALKERFSNHHHAFGFALHKATHLAVLCENNESVRRAIEADLIGNYSPRLNQTNHG